MEAKEIAQVAVGGGIIIGILWWLTKTLRGEEVPPGEVPPVEVKSFTIEKR